MYRIKCATVIVSVLIFCSGCAIEALGEDLWEYTPQIRTERVKQFMATSTETELPYVIEKSELVKYANLFKDACLTGPMSEAVDYLQSNRFEIKTTGRYKIKNFGYTDYKTNPKLFEKVVPPEYRSLAISMAAADGTVPVIESIFIPYNAPKEYTDGKAVASVSIGPKINNQCSLSVRVPDDEPLIEELERIVEESGRNLGAPKDTGFFGIGYVVGLPPTEIIALGRQNKPGPTSLIYIVPR